MVRDSAGNGMRAGRRSAAARILHRATCRVLGEVSSRSSRQRVATATPDGAPGVPYDMYRNDTAHGPHRSYQHRRPGETAEAPLTATAHHIAPVAGRRSRLHPVEKLLRRAVQELVL